VKLSHRSFLWIVFASLSFVTACQSGAGPTPADASRPRPTPAPVSTPTAAPAPSELTVCLGQEPNTLYPYGEPNAAARSVLAAVYDGPIDSLSYGYQPVILQKMPSLADGDAFIESVPVSDGDEVVDADGLPVTLAAGVRVYPSGCQSASCIVAYDGQGELEMDQMTVTFSLLPNLRWADGEPLTADDSVYAFDLASNADTPVSKFLIDRTASYEVVDRLTLTWRGKPGYRDATYMTNFWAPMPYHAWGGFSPSDLLDADVSARFPVGWGAYVVEEWLPGEFIRLARNPLYFRAGEGLPKMDALVFRFVADPDAALAALLNGECDLLDPSIRLDGQAALLLQLQNAGQVRVSVVTAMSMEWLAVGIRPASYDDGHVSGGDRPDILADSRTRRAIAMCLDRQQVVDTVLHGLSTVPDTYIPAGHPLYNPSVPSYAFDVTTATLLLDEIGWKDLDGDPSTPRQAYNVTAVPSGTPLVLNYMTTTAIQRRQVSEILSRSLRQCGIGVDVQYLAPEAFYAPGPDGPLFGRNFDLAQFAIGSEGFQPPCGWYTTQEIPNRENHWLGANVSGYSNGEYDAACQRALRALPDEPEYASAFQDTQAIFSEDLPSIPLYAHLRVAAARPDLCGFSLDSTSDSALWNVEAFDYGEVCSP